MTSRPPDNSTEALQEVRRLLAELADKQREVDAIAKALSRAAGLDDEDRPQRERLSRSDFRNLCKAKPHERISKKKRSALDSGLV